MADFCNVSIDVHFCARCLWIFSAGVIGGLVNAFFIDDGLVMPQMVKTSDNKEIFKPGFLQNLFIGGVAAICSWGLYGGDNVTTVYKSGKLMPSEVELHLFSIVGALFVGVAGARWIIAETERVSAISDRKSLTEAVRIAAGSKPDPAVISELSKATSTEEVVNSVKKLASPTGLEEK